MTGYLVVVMTTAVTGMMTDKANDLDSGRRLGDGMVLMEDDDDDGG